MVKEDIEKLKEARAKKEARITKQWKNFAASNGRDAYKDLIEYIDTMREMYIRYGEERAMPHPNPNNGGVVPIDNDTVAALLQNARGLSIVKTYIQSRIDQDVAQPHISN